MRAFRPTLSQHLRTVLEMSVETSIEGHRAEVGPPQDEACYGSMAHEQQPSSWPIYLSTQSSQSRDRPYRMREDPSP